MSTIEKLFPDERGTPSDGKTPSLYERVAHCNEVGHYRAAERVEMTLLRKLAVAADLLVASLQCLILSTLLLVKALLGLLIPPTQKDIRGQLALVTGGGNGLGRELSLELARCGVQVVVVDVDSLAAEQTAKDICRLTGCADTARAYTTDVSSAESVRELQSKISADWSRPVDILVNNAGLVTAVSLVNGTDADIDRVIDVNLKSHFWMLRTFLPGMASAGRGHVLTISSMAGVMGLSRACAYTATKFGLRGLCQALQAELRDAGAAECVRLTTAYPYFLVTRKELVENVDLRIPPINPEEAARLIVAGVRRNALQVSVPSYMLFLINIISIMPDEVVEVFRKTFKTEIKL